MVGVLLGRVTDSPVLPLVIACAATAVLAAPVTVGAIVSRHWSDTATSPKALNALRQAVAQRVPVVQDDNLGALAVVVQPHAGGFG